MVQSEKKKSYLSNWFQCCTFGPPFFHSFNTKNGLFCLSEQTKVCCAHQGVYRKHTVERVVQFHAINAHHLYTRRWQIALQANMHPLFSVVFPQRNRTQQRTVDVAAFAAHHAAPPAAGPANTVAVAALAVQITQTTLQQPAAHGPLAQAACAAGRRQRHQPANTVEDAEPAPVGCHWAHGAGQERRQGPWDIEMSTIRSHLDGHWHANPERHRDHQAHSLVNRVWYSAKKPQGAHCGCNNKRLERVAGNVQGDWHGNNQITIMHNIWLICLL